MLVSSLKACVDSKICSTLTKLSTQLIKNHPDVDHGGCCVVAAHVAKHLSKIVPNIRIVVCNSDKVDLGRIRKRINTNNMNEWNNNRVYFNHVLVEFEDNGKKYVFDSTHGPVPAVVFWTRMSFYKKARGSLTIEEATILADTDDWNPTFERDEIPVIRRRITKFFNKEFFAG